MGSQFSHGENEQRFSQPGRITSYDAGQDLFNEAYSGNFLLGATRQEQEFKRFGSVDPSIVSFDPIELGGPLRRDSSPALPIKIDGHLAPYPGWQDPLDPGANGDTTGDQSGSQPSHDAGALQKTFEQMSAGQLTSMIFSLPDSERNAIIAALPQGDQEKYFQGFATIDMIDIKAAQENSLSRLPKDDLAKAVSEVLSDPDKYKEKAAPKHLTDFKPSLIE